VTNLLILKPIGLCIEVVEGLIIIVVVAVVVHVAGDGHLVVIAR